MLPILSFFNWSVYCGFPDKGSSLLIEGCFCAEQIQLFSSRVFELRATSLRPEGLMYLMRPWSGLDEVYKVLKWRWLHFACGTVMSNCAQEGRLWETNAFSCVPMLFCRKWFCTTVNWFRSIVYYLLTHCNCISLMQGWTFRFFPVLAGISLLIFNSKLVTLHPLCDSGAGTSESHFSTLPADSG